MNYKFYLISFAITTILVSIGFLLGMDWGFNYLIAFFNIQVLGGLDAFSVGILSAGIGLVFAFLSSISALIILHKLSKRFFPGVAFLKTTGLAFLTFLLLIISYLLFWPQ